MEINLKQSLYNMKGKELENKNEEGKMESFSIQEYLVNVCLTQIDKDNKQKFKDFTLASKINESNGQINLETKEIQRILKKLEEIASPLIYGQLYNILEGNENPLKPKPKTKSKAKETQK